MKTYLIAFLTSFVYVIFITPILIVVGKKLGLVDKVNRRKIHQGIIPRIGGIGISTGVILPLILMLVVHDNFNNSVVKEFYNSHRNIIVFLVGGFLISTLGIIDDIKNISAKFRFLFQIGLAVVAFYMDFRIDIVSTPFGSIDFGFFSLPITILWVVGIINAFNLIDGLDGLSSGIAFFVSITVLILAYHNNQLVTIVVASSLAGAVAGFLIYNFNPAKIFMGDSGSMFIGYMLAVISLQGGVSKKGAFVSLIIPVMAMGLPILDTTLAFTRRLLRNQPIFAADRQHIHHILLSKGWNQKRVVITLYAISMLFTSLALFFTFMDDAEKFLILLVFSIVVLVLITKLGYTEMFYSKFRLRKEKSMESFLSEMFIEQISSMSFKKMEKFIYSLPIKGYSLISPDGKELYFTGEKDETNFLDVHARDDYYLRFFWQSVVPTINSREAVMFGIIAASALNYIDTSENAEIFE